MFPGDDKRDGVVSVELGKCWGKLSSVCDFLDDDNELKRKIRVYGPGIVRQCAEELLPQALRDQCLDRIREQLPWEADELEEKLEERLSKARSLLEPKQLELYVDCPSEVYTDEEVRVSLTLKNPNIESANVNVEVSGDFDLAQPFQNSFAVPFLSSKSFEILLRPKGKGKKRLMIRVKDQVSTRQEEFLIDVKEYRVELEANIEVPKEIVLGEDFTVTYKLKNKGLIDLEVDVVNPFNPNDKTTLILRPGEETSREYVGKLENEAKYFQAPTLAYRDIIRGNKFEAQFKPVEIKVSRRREEKVEEEERREEPRREEVKKAATLEDALEQISRHLLFGLAGYVVGRFFKEKVEYPKPVYVEDVPHATKDDVTVVFSDRTSVVEEDLGDYILIRKASLEEVIRTVTVGGAKSLLGDFRVRIQGKLENWRPPFAPDSRVEWRQILSPEDSLKELAKELHTDVKKLEGLPGNFCLEYDYKEPGLLGKSLLKIYAGGSARLKRLHSEGRDSKALTLDEALESLGLKDLKAKERVVLILASPTGWSPASIETAKGVSGRTLYVLVDLKTGEIFYNRNENLLVDLVSELYVRRAPLPASEDVYRLDRELLDGKIPEEFYGKKLEELLRVS